MSYIYLLLTFQIGVKSPSFDPYSSFRLWKSSACSNSTL